MRRAILLAACLLALDARGANIVTLDVACAGWYFRQPIMPQGQPRSPLMIWCPGATQARLTIARCYDSRVKRDSRSGYYVVSCGTWGPWK